MVRDVQPLVAENLGVAPRPRRRRPSAKTVKPKNADTSLMSLCSIPPTVSSKKVVLIAFIVGVMAIALHHQLGRPKCNVDDYLKMTRQVAELEFENDALRIWINRLAIRAGVKPMDPEIKGSQETGPHNIDESTILKTERIPIGRGGEWIEKIKIVLESYVRPIICDFERLTHGERVECERHDKLRVQKIRKRNGEIIDLLVDPVGTVPDGSCHPYLIKESDMDEYYTIINTNDPLASNGYQWYKMIRDAGKPENIFIPYQRNNKYKVQKHEADKKKRDDFGDQLLYERKTYNGDKDGGKKPDNNRDKKSDDSGRGSDKRKHEDMGKKSYEDRSYQGKHHHDLKERKSYNENGGNDKRKEKKDWNKRGDKQERPPNKEAIYQSA